MDKQELITSSLTLMKSRKEVIFGISWTTALATLIAGNGFPSITKSFLSIIAMTLLSLSVYIYNDITDCEMDSYSNQEKKKGRPIAHGKVAVNFAHKFVTITALLGMLVCAYLGSTVLIIGISFFIIFYLYSYPKVRFKKMFVIKNLVTALLMPTAFLIGGVAINGIITGNILFYSLAYFILMFSFAPASADWLDYEEDIAFKIKTIGNTYSWKQNILLFNFGILSISLTSVINYWIWGSHYLSLLLVTGFGLPIMVYSIKLSNENGLTASYKLRPYAYGYLLLTPLFIALGVLF